MQPPAPPAPSSHHGRQEARSDHGDAGRPRRGRGEFSGPRADSRGPAAPPRPAVEGTVTADPGHDVSLATGQEAELSTKDITVRYTRLVEDSRCKPGLHCIWEGDAAVAVTLTQPGRGEHTDTQLHTGRRGPHATTFAAAQVELVGVSVRGDRITLRVT